MCSPFEYLYIRVITTIRWRVGSWLMVSPTHTNCLISKKTIHQCNFSTYEYIAARTHTCPVIKHSTLDGDLCVPETHDTRHTQYEYWRIRRSQYRWYNTRLKPTRAKFVGIIIKLNANCHARQKTYPAPQSHPLTHSAPPFQVEVHKYTYRFTIYLLNALRRRDDLRDYGSRLVYPRVSMQQYAQPTCAKMPR